MYRQQHLWALPCIDGARLHLLPFSGANTPGWERVELCNQNLLGIYLWSTANTCEGQSLKQWSRQCVIMSCLIHQRIVIVGWQILCVILFEYATAKSTVPRLCDGADRHLSGERLAADSLKVVLLALSPRCESQRNNVLASNWQWHRAMHIAPRKKITPSMTD